MKQKLVGISAGLLLLALMVAGCGGGGGGTTAAGGNTAAPAAYGRMGAAISFGQSAPARLAASYSTFQYTEYDTQNLELTEDIYLYQGCGDFDAWMDALQNVSSSDASFPAYVFVTEDPESLYNAWYPYTSTYYGAFDGPLASACTSITGEASAAGRVSLRTSGVFEVNNVLAGENRLVEAVVFNGEAGYGVYVAGVVDVDEGAYTENVTISPETTLAAAAVHAYTALNSTTFSMVDDTAIDAINSAVASIFPNGFSYGEAVMPEGLAATVTFTSYSDFSYLTATGTLTWQLYVLDQAGLYDASEPVIPTASMPTIVAFYPADGETSWPSEAPYFKIQFDQTMDTTITPIGFSLTILNTGTSGMLTIDDTNASSYGTFSWITLTNTDDTLMFQLNSNTTLTAGGLKTLQPNTTYTITGFSPPGNLANPDGLPVDITGAPTTGSFTTGAGIYPAILNFSPADGATGVMYDGTDFTMVFDQQMDDTVTPAGFSITILNTNTSGTLVIDGSNASSYGTFSWTTTNTAMDTLVFGLLPSSTLTANSLQTLQPSTTYAITSWTAPSNLVSMGAMPLDTTGQPTTGSFTTAGGI